MGLLDWLHKKASGDHSAELTIDKNEQNFSGLNLKQVIDAHMAWRTRLVGILDGSNDERPEISEVAMDNLCILGKWLYGTAKPLYSKLPEYEELRQTHAKFHLCAGEILMEFKRGDQDKAEDILRGEFRTLSDQIQLDLVRLYSAGVK